MPNWCFNDLTLYHEDTSNIDEVVELLERQEADGYEGDTIFFNHFRPLPKEEEENWYGWHVENWGTKWDVSIQQWERQDDNSLWLQFDSAWGPPIAFYDFMEENDWSVSAQYHECGQCFVGEYSSGDDNFIEYDFSDENWREGIPEDLIEFAGLEYDYENWLEWQEEETDEDNIS